MQHRMGEHLGTQCIGHRLQHHAALTHPLGECRAGNGHPCAPEDRFLAIERQVVLIFGDQHLGQQPRRGDAFIDHMRRHRGLGERFTLGTHPFAANVALDGEDTRGVVELLGNILADAGKRAATGADGGVGFVVNVSARQVRRQRGAARTGCCRRRGLAGLGGDGVNLGLDGRHIGLDGFFKQLCLFARELLGARAETGAAQLGDFKAELVDPGLTQGQLTVHRAHELPQFRGVELVEVGGVQHGAMMRECRGIGHRGLPLLPTPPELRPCE